MISMRLMRFGTRKKPSYRIVVIDSKKPREGKAMDFIGFYNPLKEPAEFSIDYERAKYWLDKGVQTSKTVQFLLDKVSKSKKLSN